MPAAVYAGEATLTIEEIAVPRPGPGDALLEVSYCGVCGSDLHFVIEGWGRPGSIYGHEYSGVVAAVGSGVSTVRVGDRVVGGPGHGCGVCPPCTSGRQNLCLSRPKAGITPTQGAFAGYIAVKAGSLFSIPTGLDLRTAALAEPTAVALRGVRRAGLLPGQRALVVGAGPIGLLTVGCLRALGIDDVTVSEPMWRRRARATEVGATRAVPPEELVGPRLPMDVLDDPFDAAFECSGRADAVQAALTQLGRGGMLVLSGTGMVRPELDTNRVILNELMITGTLEYTRADFQAALELLASGCLPTDALIEPSDVRLPDLTAAMQGLASGELAGKVMAVPRA